MRFRQTLPLLALLVIAACRDWTSPTSPPETHEPRWDQTPTSVRFATIGDYGKAGTPEADVARLVRSWNPDHVITLGDNNYESGAASTIDVNIGQYYSSFIHPYKGSYGPGATANRFWPSLGNHDYATSGATPYLEYFTLPGNERYYEIRQGPVHFFAINSNSQEPHGNSSTSVQANWLRSALAASTAPWKVVFFHHPPYSSGDRHGNTSVMQWPFQAWGADIVMAGHDHVYERLIVNGFPYIVNGLGGKSIYGFGTIRPGSVVRYNSDYGAQLVDATDQSMTLRFYSRSGTLVDTYTMTKDGGTDPPPTGTSISFQNGALPTSAYAGTIDTHLSQNDPTTNYGSAATLLADGDDPSGTDKRAMLKWDVSAVPSTATVTGASITFNVTNVSSHTYELYQLRRNWTESGATWVDYASGAAWGTPGADASTDRGTTVLGTVTGSSAGSRTFTLNSAGVALVQGWVNGSIANQGVMLMDPVNTNGLDVSSSEAGTVAARPKLTITYTSNGGTPPTDGATSFQNGALPTSAYAGAIDTHLSENNTATNYGGAGTLLMDGDDPSGTDKRAMLRWDVSAIPSTATVTGASITFNVVATSAHTYELYQLRRNWTESGATWVDYASGTAWATPGADASTDRGTTVLGTVTGSSAGPRTFTLNSAGVALVQGWVDGSIANQGVIIFDDANTDGLDVSSSEAGTVAARPKLTVTWSAP